MARKTKLNHPSFFKIMVGDFSSKLRVPPAFVKNFKQKTSPLKFIFCLTSLMELSWKVKVESSSSGCYYFTRGWSKIVKDLQLEEGDFLVFYLVAAEHAFHVAVYDPTCCLKNIPVAATSTEFYSSPQNDSHMSIKQEINVEEEVRTEAKDQKNNCSFTKTLATYNRSYCTFPLWFVRESGLWKKKCVVVTDRLGRKWSIRLKHREGVYHRYDLTTGWSAFRRDNGLAAGDTVKFKHIKGCMLELEVLPRRN